MDPFGKAATDRREGGRHGEGDRRVIPRFTDYSLNSSIKMSRLWYKVLGCLMAAFVASELIFSLLEKDNNIFRGLFFLITFSVLIFLLFRQAKNITTFLDSHSINNLRRIQDHQNYLLAYVAIVVGCLFVLGLIARIQI